MRLDWQVTTDPTEEPVTLADMKLHLRVDNNDEDELISALIKAARMWCEGYQGRAYLTQTLTVKFDAFVDCLDLPRPPLQSLTITYVDTDGDTQTLSSTYYSVDTTSEPGRLYLAYNQSWPSTRNDKHAVTVTAVCGWETVAAVPAQIKAAIKLLVAHLYENREAVSSLSLHDVPLSIKSLLATHRMMEL